MHLQLKSYDIQLILLFVSLSVVITLRVQVEATGYRSPDSYAYLGAAQRFLDGTSPYQIKILRSDLPLTTDAFTVWPVGYPLMIYATARLTGTDVSMASKLLNVALIAVMLLLFRQISPIHAPFLGLILCSFTFLEVFSYTWSDAPFLVLLLWFCQHLHRYLYGEASTASLVWLLVASLGMFLCRYIGAFSFGVLAGAGIYCLRYKRDAQGRLLLMLAALLTAVGGLYLYNNYLQGGSLAGARTWQPKALWPFLGSLLAGVSNEGWVIRNYYFRGYPDVLWIITTFFQLGLMAVAFTQVKKKRAWPKGAVNSFTRLLWGVGAFYLATLVLLHYFLAVDAFDYRLLAPASLLGYLGIHHHIARHPSLYASLRGYACTLYLTSLLLNLPKEYLLETLTGPDFYRSEYGTGTASP